jgi:hypothetical protein
MLKKAYKFWDRAAARRFAGLERPWRSLNKKNVSPQARMRKLKRFRKSYRLAVDAEEASDFWFRKLLLVDSLKLHLYSHAVFGHQ